MGVLFAPFLRVQGVRRVQARSVKLFVVFKAPFLRVQGVRRVQARSVKLFVVFKDASNKLFVRE